MCELNCVTYYQKSNSPSLCAGMFEPSDGLQDIERCLYYCPTQLISSN